MSAGQGLVLWKRLYKLLHYYIELNGDSFDVGIRDFYVYWTPFEELNAKMGYFKAPFNQQRMTTSAKLLLRQSHCQ